MSVQQPRIYLAGPDVFRPDAKQHFQMLAHLCQRRGLHAVIPADEAIFDATGLPKALSIYEANIRLLRSAHGVVANLQDFRGTEPDAGTAFEVGFATALGLPVVGYGVPTLSYAQRVESTLRCERDGQGVLRTSEASMAVEDFDLQLNLMLGCSVQFEISAERAIERMSAMLSQTGVDPGRAHDDVCEAAKKAG